MVYKRVPSSWIRRSLLGIVMLWATDFFPLWKNVSGVQILLAIKLFNRRIFIGPLNFNRSSFHLWRKKTSIVYSYNGIKICFFFFYYEKLICIWGKSQRNTGCKIPLAKFCQGRITITQNCMSVSNLFST